MGLFGIAAALSATSMATLLLQTFYSKHLIAMITESPDTDLPIKEFRKLTRPFRMLAQVALWSSIVSMLAALAFKMWVEIPAGIQGYGWVVCGFMGVGAVAVAVAAWHHQSSYQVSFQKLPRGPAV